MQRNQVSCTSCHKVHAKCMTWWFAGLINEQCASRHLNVWAQFQHNCGRRHVVRRLPAIRTAAFARQCCSRSAPNEGTLYCHGDKCVGPFEHAPVRFEGLRRGRHQAHGSANAHVDPQEVRAVPLVVPRESARRKHATGCRSSAAIVPRFSRSPRFQNCTVCSPEDFTDSHRGQEPSVMKALVLHCHGLTAAGSSSHRPRSNPLQRSHRRQPLRSECRGGQRGGLTGPLD